MKIKIPNALRERWEQLPLKQRQYLFLGGALVGGFVLVWLVLTVGSSDKPPRRESVVKLGKDASVTNVAAPGKVSPLDEWVGNAGHKLAQYEKERQQQERINAEHAATEKRIFERLDALSRQPTVHASPAAQTPPPEAEVPPSPPAPPSRSTSPASGPPRMPPGAPPSVGPATPAVPVDPAPAVPVISRVTLGSTKPASDQADGKGRVAASTDAERSRRAVTKGDAGTFLPVGSARGVLLGGIDAPTGGQAQTNPQPVLIRLLDNAVLPNRYRAQVRECLVVAAGYGDISSERALFRTVSLSCVRHDGTVLEADLKGNVYGEDGKLGMRGRLVTKQGQLLANALRAGIVGGIGDGFVRSGMSVSTGAYGSVATQAGDMSQNMERGVMRGVGRAMDQLAEDYVRLAEKTFPIIEIDAGRQVDVVITKGVYLPIQPGRSETEDDASGGQP